MSPEQVKDSRSVDGRADIYSIGVMLYEILTGTLPTGIFKPASQTSHGIPPALDAIVTKCVELEPADRYQTVGELHVALSAVRAALAPSPPAQGAAPSAASQGRRKGVGWALMAALVAVVALALWRLETLGPEEVSPQTAAAGVAIAPIPFDALQPLVTRLNAVAEKAADNDSVKKELLSHAGDTWKLALEGGPKAKALAIEAVQTYLALANKMALVPEGMVTVSDDPQAGTLRLPAYLVDETEVTNRQYLEFVHKVRDGWRLPSSLAQAGATPPDAVLDTPVTSVTFYDAQAYASWAGKQLPTEPQWARAAYGASSAPAAYPWGADWDANPHQLARRGGRL